MTAAVARAQRSQPAPEVDVFAAKLLAVSTAACMRWDPSETHRSSFSASMRMFMAEEGETAVLTVLTAWEAARGDKRRPDLGRLWYSGRREREFRDKALGRTAEAHSGGLLSDKGVDKAAEWEIIKAKKAAAKAQLAAAS